MIETKCISYSLELFVQHFYFCSLYSAQSLVRLPEDIEGTLRSLDSSISDLSRLASRAPALICAVQRTTLDVTTEFHLSRDEPMQRVVLPKEGLETVIQLAHGERSGQSVCVPGVFGVSTADTFTCTTATTKTSTLTEILLFDFCRNIYDAFPFLTIVIHVWYISRHLVDVLR